MKKLLLFAALLFMPILVSAKVSLASSINIDGIGNAPLNGDSWSVKLTTTLDYTDITVTPVRDTVKVEGAGRVAIEEGSNDITITLTEGDTVETYVIHMTMNRPKTDTNGNPETGAFVPVMIVVVGVLALVGIIFIGDKGKLKKI
jgi:hypothetical protein